jgi:hypothetical protein
MRRPCNCGWSGGDRVSFRVGFVEWVADLFMQGLSDVDGLQHLGAVGVKHVGDGELGHKLAHKRLPSLVESVLLTELRSYYPLMLTWRSCLLDISVLLETLRGANSITY